MFKRCRCLVHPINVHAAFVGKCALSNIRHVLVQTDVGNFRYHPTGLHQLVQIFRWNALIIPLQLQIRDDCRKICIAAAFSKADQRSLYHLCACQHRHHTAGNRHSAIIMSMDANRNPKLRKYLCYNAADFIRKCTAVCLT